MYSFKKCESDKRLFWIGIDSFLVLLVMLFLFDSIIWFRSQRVMQGNSDFTIYYTAATLVHRYPASELYDMKLQEHVQRRTLKPYHLSDGLLPYNHPPFEMMLFYPMGWFSYRVAFLVWLGMNLSLMTFLPAIAGVANLRGVISRKRTLYLGVFSYYPFLICLWQGQDSIVFTWILILIYLNLRKENDFMAGLFLSAGFMKFQTIYPLVIVLLVKRRWNALAGFGLSLASLLAISTAWVGIGGWRMYLDGLARMSILHHQMGFSPERMQNWVGQLCLWGFLAVRRPAGLVLVALLGIAFVVLIWMRQQDCASDLFNLQFAATILICVLASPHVYIHDLSAAFLPLMLCANYLMELSRFTWREWALVLMLLLSPILLIYSLPLAMSYGVQPNVFLFSLMLLLVLLMTSNEVK